MNSIPFNTRIFIDTNILLYAITDHPRFGSWCNTLLDRIHQGEVPGYISVIVLNELIHQLIVGEIAQKTSLTAHQAIQFLKRNREILEELETLIAQLLALAEKSQSYHLLTEIYFLKGKLALLTLDMKKARKFLTQAQRIAERWGFNQLATKISLEHDKLRNQLSIWDEIREEEISLSERKGQVRFLTGVDSIPRRECPKSSGGT